MFTAVNHRGQLGHLQSELVDPLSSYAAVVVCQCRTSVTIIFSVKSRCNHFPFFEVRVIGPCPHVIVFTLDSVLKRFRLIFVTVFMGYVWTEGKIRKKLLSFQRKTDTCGRGVVVRERREYCSPVSVQSIKIKCVNN